jgi:hypothetical protein
MISNIIVTLTWDANILTAVLFSTALMGEHRGLMLARFL